MESTMEGIKMTGNYLEFGLQAGEASVFELAYNETISDYYLGLYGDDVQGKVDEAKAGTSITKLLMTKHAANEFIENIHILSEKKNLNSSNGNTLWKEKVKEADQIPKIYDQFVNQENAERNSGFQEGIWIGTSSSVDELIGISADDYALRYVRSIPSTKACILLDISSKAIQQVLQGMDYDDQSIAAFVPPNGDAVCYSPDETLTENPPDFKIFLEQIMKETGEGAEIVTREGKNYYLFYATLKESGAIVCCLIPESALLRQLGSIGTITRLIVIVSCLLALLVAFVFSGNIRKVIYRVNAHLNEISSGNLSAVLKLHRKDEFLSLSHGINDMQQNISRLIDEVREQSMSVTGSSEEIKHASQNIASAIDEVGAMTSQIHEGVLNQTQEADAGYEMMERLADEIDSIHQKIDAIVIIADDTKVRIQNGTKTMEILNDKTCSAGKSMNEILVHMNQLREKSNAIVTIVDAMNQIANETNLLSLNASIEAARAGASGRGFGVVANEIGSLAKDSMNSAKMIEKTIQEILKETEDTFAVVTRTEKVVSEQTTAVKDTVGSFHEIHVQVDQLLEEVQQVDTNTKSIHHMKDETLLTIQSMAAVSQESVAASENVVSNMKLQVQEVEKLIRLSEKLNNNAFLLEQGVIRFKNR